MRTTPTEFEGVPLREHKKRKRTTNDNMHQKTRRGKKKATDEKQIHSTYWSWFLCGNQVDWRKPHGYKTCKGNVYESIQWYSGGALHRKNIAAPSENQRNPKERGVYHVGKVSWLPALNTNSAKPAHCNTKRTPQYSTGTRISWFEKKSWIVSSYEIL